MRARIPDCTTPERRRRVAPVLCRAPGNVRAKPHQAEDGQDVGVRCCQRAQSEKRRDKPMQAPGSLWSIVIRIVDCEQTIIRRVRWYSWIELAPFRKFSLKIPPTHSRGM